MSFASDMRRGVANQKKAISMIVRGTALDLSASIFRRTPVRTGRLRGNWQTELNGFSGGEVSSSPANAIDQSKRIINRAKVEDSIFIVNNLPYAGVIERGHSKQAPQGMVGITIRAFKRLVAKNAKRVK